MPLSLQCPRCNGSVSVADQAAGKRVKCPHCEQTFLAPGIAAASSDDDDWLSLDEPVQSPSTAAKGASPAAPAVGPPDDMFPGDLTGPELPPVPVSGGPPSPKTEKRGPALTSEEEALLSEFTSDLDEFTAEIETPPPPHPSSLAAGPSGPPAATPFRGIGGTAPKPPAKPAVPEYATEYRVTCHICGSFLYAKAAQAGKTLKCADCHSPITIPPPPKIKKKPTMDLDRAETFALEQTRVADRGPDPYKKSAQQLLDEASRTDEVNPEPDYDTPSVKEWLATVFGIFKDLGVLAHWIGLSVLGSVPAVIALSLDSPILTLALFPAGFILGVLTVSCGLAILTAVANQEESVKRWPTLDPMARPGQLLTVWVAASVVTVPLCALVVVLLGPSLIGTAITMFSVYALFPFVLLSMLDMKTPFVPFSAEVARSVTKCEEAWGGFYFSSGLLFVALFLVFASAGGGAAGAVVSITAGIGATFIYFSMIGRLAYAIGQTINN